MDLSTLEPGEIDIEIPNPKTGGDSGLSFKMMSPSDKRAQLARRKFNDIMLRKPSAEKVENASLAYISSLATGWEWKGELTWKGSKPMFSDKAVREVLSEMPWVREYLDEKLVDKEAFFQK